ncbi:MAG: hypothetical protein M3Z13_01505, partial [Candidatus Dormibacteraeota bacterium]|nr:hypothetical protein [Candidatus Dormibacteraeota bacterium]
VEVGAKTYDLWSGHLSVPAHGNLILTQTQPGTGGKEPNFDTSENPDGTTAAQTAVPVVHIVANGKKTDVKDSERILTTGGRDIGTLPGNPNESHEWTKVATFEASAPESSSPWELLGIGALAAFLISLLGFLPALIGAIILLLVGYFLARLAARLVTLLLARLGFGVAAERAGLAGLLGRHRSRSASTATSSTVSTASVGGDAAHHRHTEKWSPAWIIGVIVGVFVFAFFFEAAVQALGLTELALLVNKFALWLPNLLIALVILVLGMLLARIVGRMLLAGATANGIGNPNLVSKAGQGLVIVLVVMVALHHLGVATTLVDLLFAGFCAALAVALGLAFGLGGQNTAREMINRWYGSRRRVI